MRYKAAFVTAVLFLAMLNWAEAQQQILLRDIMVDDDSGGMLFVNSASPKELEITEDTELFWDDTAKRLGVLIAAPLYSLHVGGVVAIDGIGDGGLLNYDLKVGDTDGTPTYGMLQIGNSMIGRTSYNVGNIDLDGTLMVRNIGGPATSEIEFIWTESAGNTCRFALPKSAVGNATYNSRSMMLAGPAPADTDFVKVTYWQGTGIFDNLACDTAGDGADLGIQNDLEVEGDLFIDSIIESTVGSGIIFSNNIELWTASELRLRDADNSNYVGFEAPALTGNQIWVLPSSDGNANEILETDAGGTLTWTTNKWADTVFNTGMQRLGGSVYNHTSTGPVLAEVWTQFIFEGTAYAYVAGNEKFTVNATESAGGPGCVVQPSIEIYDATNTNQLATVTLTIGATGFYSDTSFVNVPAGQALIQVRATVAAGCTVTGNAMSWTRTE